MELGFSQRVYSSTHLTRIFLTTEIHHSERNKILDDCRITTAKFRRASEEIKTDSKQEPSGLKQENTTKK